MLKKSEFDVYYFIVCSRGPGTETITVNGVDEDAKWKLDEGARQQFKKWGVCMGWAEWADEGFLVCVPKGTMPLAGIFSLITADIKASDDHLEAMLKRERKRGDAKVYAFSDSLLKKQREKEQAYLSACLRVWLQTLNPNDDGLNNRWTSTNGWRLVDLEVLSRNQLEKFVAALGITYDELATWKCAVIQETLKRAREGKLPKGSFRGC